MRCVQSAEWEQLERGYTTVKERAKHCKNDRKGVRGIKNAHVCMSKRRSSKKEEEGQEREKRRAQSLLVHPSCCVARCMLC